MIRRLLLYTFPITMLFAGVMVAIRAHPYQDDGLRAFLLPENCPAPCWQGIRPGRMDVKTALDILRSHAWIRRVDTSLYDGFRGWITWDWNGHEPAWLLPSERDNLWIDQNLVVNVSLMTSLRFGDLWLALGMPDWTNSYYTRSRDVMRVFNGYADETLVVIFEIRCNQGLGGLWFAPTSLIWPIYLPEQGEIANGSPQQLSACN